MTALLRAEVRKTLTVRSTLVVAGFVVLYPLLALLPAVLAGDPPDVDAGTLLDLLRGGADVLTLAALLLGILAAAGEYRHGTIVPALLVAPRRHRVLAAKLGSQAAMAVVVAVVMSVVAIAAGRVYLASRDVSVDLLSSDVALTVAGVTLVATLYAAVGVAVGALVRNQTAAVAGALIWVFAVENAIPLVLRNPGLRRWLPGGASERLLQLADPVAGMASVWLALVLFAGLAVALAGAATVVNRLADVQ